LLFSSREAGSVAKKRMKLKVRLPPYVAPRYRWRERIHEEICRVMRESRIRYRLEDRLQLDIRLYMDRTALHMHDVDNRLKDIMDALQGRAGGSKKVVRLPALISNDSQIFKVTIEKLNPPRQSHGLGHLTVRKYNASFGR